MPSSKFAEFISELFGPHLWMPLMLFLLIFQTGLSANQISLLLPGLFFFLIFIPFFYLHLAIKMGWVSHWDLPKKEERRTIMVIFIICSIFSYILIHWYGTPLISGLFSILLVIGFLVSAITVFWKISIHMVMDTTGVLLINFLLGWQFWPLIILIPLVGWARFKLKRHTLSQIIAGTLLPSFVLFAAVDYFKI